MAFSGSVLRAPRAEAPRVSLLTSVEVNRLVVPEPVIDPVTGLEVVSGLPVEWQRGYAYLPRACGTSGAGVICGDDAQTEKVITAGANVAVQVQPWYVWAGDVCSAFGKDVDLDGRAAELLAAGTAHEVEFELWRGDIAQAESYPNPYLADLPANHDLNGGTAVAPTQALSALQQALSASGTGGRGMIHATARTVSLWFATMELRRVGQAIFDPFDNVIVPGTGYDGSGPDGDVDETGRYAWAYATDMVDVFLDDAVRVGQTPWETLDRAKNTIETRYERIAAASWEGCRHYGVNVDLGAAVSNIPVRTA